MRGVEMETHPLSKRGTSQKFEVKELEISAVERSLATVIDQYMFVDQSVRPIKVRQSATSVSHLRSRRRTNEPPTMRA